MLRSTCSQCPLYTSHLVFDAPRWDICWWCPFQPHLRFFNHGHWHFRCGWPLRENISVINPGKLHMVEMDTRARHESNLPTRERVMGQRGKLKGLARRMNLGFCATDHLPLPWASINTYFSLRAKCWLRGGAGVHFPRNLDNWSGRDMWISLINKLFLEVVIK